MSIALHPLSQEVINLVYKNRICNPKPIVLIDTMKFLYNVKYQGKYEQPFFQGSTRGGRAPRPPLRLPQLREGGLMEWDFNITSSSGNLHSTLHCIALTQTKRLRKELKYILIHNNALQRNLSDQVLHKNSMFPIWKTEYFYLWFLYKSDSRISCFRNDGEMKVLKVHRTCHSINRGSLEIAHVFHLSITTSYKENTLKSHFCP